jgi:hypothetical protein
MPFFVIKINPHMQRIFVFFHESALPGKVALGIAHGMRDEITQISPRIPCTLPLVHIMAAADYEKRSRRKRQAPFL